MSIARITRLESYPTGAPVSLDLPPNSHLFRAQFKNITLYLLADYHAPQFSAVFIKDGSRVYFPKEARFTAKSYDTLLSHIQIEARTSQFSEFLGVLNKKKILATLSEMEDHPV